MRRGYRIRPIGVVRSEIKKPGEAPKQGALSGTEGKIVVDPVYAAALSGLKRQAGAPVLDIKPNSPELDG